VSAAEQANVHATTGKLADLTQRLLTYRPIAAALTGRSVLELGRLARRSPFLSLCSLPRRMHRRDMPCVDRVAGGQIASSRGRLSGPPGMEVRMPTRDQVKDYQRRLAELDVVVGPREPDRVLAREEEHERNIRPAAR
jgi:hypothetical protein